MCWLFCLFSNWVGKKHLAIVAVKSWRSQSCHFGRHFILWKQELDAYILVGGVLLALWSLCIVNVSWSADALPFGIYIYVLAMPIADSGARAMALLSLNGNTQHFWHLCICEIKTQRSIDMPGFFIFTGYYFFLLFWWWWRRWGTERSDGIARVALPKSRLFEKKCVCCHGEQETATLLVSLALCITVVTSCSSICVAVDGISS